MESGKITCPKCQSLNAEGSLFCNACGRRIAASPRIPAKHRAFMTLVVALAVLGTGSLTWGIASLVLVPNGSRPQATPTHAATATETPVLSPTSAPSPTVSFQPTLTPVLTATSTPKPTPTPKPTATPTPVPFDYDRQTSLISRSLAVIRNINDYIVAQEDYMSSLAARGGMYTSMYVNAKAELDEMKADLERMQSNLNVVEGITMNPELSEYERILVSWENGYPPLK